MTMWRPRADRECGLLSSRETIAVKLEKHLARHGLTGQVDIPWLDIAIAIQGRIFKAHRLRDLGTWVKRMTATECQ
jgi:hypothetical protein